MSFNTQNKRFVLRFAYITGVKTISLRGIKEGLEVGGISRQTMNKIESKVQATCKKSVMGIIKGL